MKINADFTARIVLRPEDVPWQTSPAAGVDRRMLDRIGGEVARATSIVRYAPGTSFNTHEHGGGEEILVLSGTFADEYGQYPAGTYLRNPPGSRHAPFSPDGCILFVKLWQFRAGDTAQMAFNTGTVEFAPGLIPGLSVLPLHDFEGENTALVRWAPGTEFQRHLHPGGEEILVLEGVFSDEHGDYPAGSWIRTPPWSGHTPFSKSGCLIYVKVGHLPPLTTFADD